MLWPACPQLVAGHTPAYVLSTCIMHAADLHESSLRTYKVTPGSKAGSGATVAVARLPAVAKQSRRPFAGSDISLQLLSEGEQGSRPRSELS